MRSYQLGSWRPPGRLERRTRRIRSRVSVWIAACCAAVVASSALLASAHPLHESLAEAEWNASTGRLEVALRVHALDVELALRARMMRPIDVEKTPRVEQMIQKYLTDAWRVTSGGDDAAPLHWVGSELEDDRMWLYFEVPLEGKPGDWTFSNRLFFELQADQVNTMNLKHGGRLQTLIFSREYPTQKP